MTARYPAYRDSGFPPFGEIPTHWSAVRLKWALSQNDGGVWGDDPDDEADTIVLRSTDQTADGRWRIADPAARRISAPDAIRHRLKEGDLLITKSSGSALHIGKTTIVNADVAQLNACFSNFMQRISFIRSVHPRFMWMILNSGLSRDQFGNLSSTTTGLANINASTINELLVPLPPLPEQRAIAGFLDLEVGKIDALVEEQRRLIALLAEKRRAVISHAVTRGLNPAAPLKPSGVDWLGDIPAHWEICLLKRAFSEVDYGISESLEAEGAVGVLRMGNIGKGVASTDNLKFVESVAPNLLLRRGDLLFNRTNSLDLIGKVGLVVSAPEAALTFASYLVRLRLRGGMSEQFFAALLNTEGVLGEARARAFVAIGQCNLNPTRYGQLTVALPPADEQQQIAEHIDTQTARLDALSAEANRAVALLLERRAALISAAVTGKIDVRALES
jgi:type I restriction enzyme S subunit